MVFVDGTLTITQISTTLTLGSSSNPSVVGDGVTFTASGLPVGATGTVQFYDGANTLGSAVAVTSGQAQYQTSTLTQGQHTIKAVYAGDATYATSQNTLAQQVFNTGPNKKCYTDKGVTVCYTNVSAPFDTNIIPISPSGAGQVPAGYTLNPPNIAFDITASANNFTGPITITFDASAVTDAGQFARLRVLHSEGGVLVDRTVLPPDLPAPNFVLKQISARTNSLSPFALALIGGLPVHLSDQKAGSVLVFPYYTSAADGNFSKSDTLLTITNVADGPSTTTNGAPAYQYLHLFFVNSECSPADTFVCLTPNGSLQIRASEYDPLSTGYLIAVAVDASGAPTQNNSFIGSAFVRDDGNGIRDAYGAEAFVKLMPGSLPANPDGSATLHLDNTEYDAAGAQFAVQVQDPAKSDQTIVLASLSGDLGAKLSATAQNGVGIIYRDDERPASFQPSLGSGCFLQRPFTAGNFRVVPGPLTSFLKDRYGYVQFQTTGPSVGLLLSKQGAAGQSVNRFSGIRGLHKLAAQSSALTVPMFAPFCQ